MNGRIARAAMVRAQLFPLGKEFCGMCSRFGRRVLYSSAPAGPFFRDLLQLPTPDS